MLHITDAMIDAAITPADAQRVLEDAFRSFGAGRAAMQERIRTQAEGVKLSTMAAVLPDRGVAGAKVYTTIEGRFSFVILLFSSVTGAPLASLEADAITRLRTAACSVIAARHLAPPAPRRLAVFGAGVQGRAHAVQFAQAYALRDIRVVDPYADPEVAVQLARECGLPVRMTGTSEALDGADIVVTASRSANPLFDGAALAPGCFVAAIGSSLPHTRELDDTALARASRIVVDWRPQTVREAGDLVHLSREQLNAKVIDFAQMLQGPQSPARAEGDIAIYKAVGVALQDIAVAALAHERIAPTCKNPDAPGA
jgi:ornithine cyclodeaminase